MNPKAVPFLPLRVYKNKSLYAILNTLLCNKLMRSKRLVSNSPFLYKYATRIVGKSLPSFILKKTFC